MTGLLIETRELRKEYRVGSQTVNALRRVTVEIRRGEFVAVMGPSGSGKSTFMNMLGCLDTPTSGRYFLDGQDVSSLPADELSMIRNQKIGFVFQSFNLLARTTALENVILPLTYGQTPRKKRRARAVEVLTAVGLADRIHHVPSQLSGGQQQRVAIGRALVGGPSLLLADEPTGALDTRTGVEIMALFQKLNRQGLTVVLVTHENEIAQFSGRILSFRDGRLLRDEKVKTPLDAQKTLVGMPEEVEAAP